MLFPFTRAWTPRQKAFIVGSAVLAFASFGALIYVYERWHRGPTDAAFLGTWKVSFRGDSPDTLSDSSWYYSFGRDHTYQMFFRSSFTEPFVGEIGTWYAGGEFLYLRIPRDPTSHAPLVLWHIDTLSPTEVRLHSGSDERLLQRVSGDSAPASNQAMERTADRSASTF